MSVFKSLITSDVIVSPFKINKTFAFEGTTALTGSGIDKFIGQNLDPILWVSGSNPTGDISIQDKYLVYRSIRELYYTNFIYGNDGSPANTASFNPDGTITGLPYEPSYYNYLPNTLPANRFFPTGSNDVVGVFSIPSNIFGEYIKPGSFQLALSASTTVLNDDGQGNLLSGSLKVGDIIYEHGLVILTSKGMPGIYGSSDITFIEDFINSSDLVCVFDSTITIYESQYKCTIRENEFNFSQNPSLISGSSNSGVIYNFATGSYFNPYVTTVGLYNNNKELLAVAKLAQPLPLSAVTDTTIMVNLDL